MDEIEGIVEEIIFRNEENGYTVFRVRPEGKDEVDLVTVVGHMGSPQAGASLRIKGRWVNNARFGRQVQMDSFESLLPATAEGIKLYLASGLIKGIGKSIAARIVKVRRRHAQDFRRRTAAPAGNFRHHPEEAGDHRRVLDRASGRAQSGAVPPAARYRRVLRRPYL